MFPENAEMGTTAYACIQACMIIFLLTLNSILVFLKLVFAGQQGRHAICRCASACAVESDRCWWRGRRAQDFVGGEDEGRKISSVAALFCLSSRI